jgi:putative membrane protein
MRLSSPHRSRLAWLTLITALACHRGPAMSGAPTASVSVPRITDGEIVAIILAANNTDLSYARLVPPRARAAEVKAFAQRMLTDHTILNTQVTDIALRHNITAQDNVTSLDFRDHSADRRDILRELDGAKFDSTYIANEIQYHHELLAAIDNALLPDARNAELRNFIVALKPAVAAHLAHAEQVRGTISSRR